jgi:hypothetical protein
MRKFKVLCLFVIGAFVLSAPIIHKAFGGEEKITKEVIVIETPKRKSSGKATAVIFPHKAHAEKQAKGDCQVCHATIKAELNASENTKKVLHKACKSCHKKGKPAEKAAKCKSCHKKKD